MIIVCGDIHGYFGKLNALINRHKPDTVLCCGDFGYWPRQHGRRMVGAGMKIKVWDQYSVFPGDTQVYWCDGNHEDFLSIKESGVDMRNPNIHYMDRGSVLTLPDGRNVLFVGGALSIDREWRVLGQTWFEEELITQKDVDNLPDVRVDIVISHTAPKYFDLSGMGIEEWKAGKFNDPSRMALNVVYDKYRPSLWYFGHFHKYGTGKYKDCYFTMLSECYDPVGRWWTDLPQLPNG